MKLKSLEIKGFKSFADKTHVILDNPITGIVGPNGCGKSNIVDAIRWVIGEHKIKALRSDNLEDLIFNGSRTRSASGMAEVSLTFENTRNLLPTEFTTVTITRKFYKNGESEYRLNDVACRLKDIHNLFLDTGVSNDSYAIIELGMVDDIIKDKDGSRRRMLEQAAGISIYKTRKKEAKQKLEATEQDISRIEDLLFEIGNNLRTLESQAKKAERYFQVKNEYKEVSIELAKASLEHFNDQYKTLNEQNDAETDRRTQLEAMVATEEAAVEQQKVKLIEKEQELNGLQKKFNDLVNRVRQLESDKKLAAQKMEHLQERDKNLRDFLAGADGQSQKLEESIAFSEKQIADETAALEKVKGELDTLRAAVDTQRAAFDAKKQALEQMRNEYQQRQRGLFEAEKKVAIADTSVMNIQRGIQQVQSEMAQRSSQISQLGTEKTDTEDKLHHRQDELQDLIDKHEEVKAKILASQEQMESLRARLVEENRKLDSRRNEHDLLKSLVESLEGYPDSIKFLKKNKDWDNSAPLLSDVFVVKNEYRTALENVLDNYLNYYIVANPQEAAKAVSLLDNNKKGKANFFILDHLSQYTPATTETPAGAIPALELVTVDDQYASLAKRLLGHVYVTADDTDISGVELQNGNVLVSKSGKMVRGRYTLGGGSVGLFEGNKIGRAKNLERLAKEIEELTQTTAELKQLVSDTQTLITGFNMELNDKAIEQARRDVNTLQNHVVNLTHRIENFDHLNQNGEKRLAELQEQLDDTHESIQDTRDALESITAELQGLQDQIRGAEEEFRTVELSFNEATQQYNNQNLAVARQQSKLDNLRQELQFRTNQLTDLKNQITSNTEQLSYVSTQLEETGKLLNSGDNELYELLTRKETEERELNEKDRAYYEMRNNISAQESALNQKRREKEHAETLLSNIKEKLGTMKLQVAGMSERLSIEFKVKLDDILDQPRTGEQTIEDLTADAEKMKKRLDNMGEINPTAIEAYTEMKVRNDFIVEQRNDLVNAKDSLLSTIEEVENTANSKFRETFDLVRENFVQVFKALFTAEDNCDLRLTDPDNIADSNIEIYAQPKGKKPSTLTQLSGGEKTLTSTAFLFAIYLIKPAPFCILDEVDAPLDDANVGKFTQMIRKFSDNSQFIIVTHNKQTMAAVDVIYGVTMQEPGVSKLVPVDFRSLN
ncbi:MAG: chromosome segregation protein SMC [Chitinophagaceae bacterium]|nr:chromosome segregation protein SMC [Chitinophagaceae bacterium]